MTAILQRDTNTITIATFYENFLLEKYNFDPPYQRKSIWSDEKQSFFIDTILKNFPVPPIFLHQHIDVATGKTRYDVIDGKQRLTSIVRFIRNEIGVSNEFEKNDPYYDQRIAGATFANLDLPELSDYKKQFWRYTIPIEYIDTTSLDVIDDIFDRLNRNGEPLTGQELRNAKYHGTPFLNLTQDLALQGFWKARLEHVDRDRMEDQEFIAELLFVLLEDGPLEALPPILDELFEKYTAQDLDRLDLEQGFLGVTEFMVALNLDYERYRIRGVSHLYGLWCFSWFCKEHNVQPLQISPRLISIFEELRSNYSDDPFVIEYKKSMSSNTKSKYMRERRLNALLGYCRVI